MTTPNLHVNTDDQRGFASRTRARTADFHYQPADADGDWPSQQSTRRFHGTVKGTNQGFSDDLNGVADHTEKSAGETDKQEGMNSSAMKDLMGMGTAAAKDVGGIVTNLGQAGTQIVTQIGTAGTQAATTGLNAAITAASTASTAATKAPGGTPMPLPAGTGSIPDSPTTSSHDEKDRHHADADANTQLQH